MIMKSASAIIIGFGISAILNLCLACPYKFKSSEEFTNQVKQCVTKLGLAEQDAEKNLEKLADPDADDQCLSQCLMDKSDVLGEDGGLDRDAFFDYLEEQAPKPLITKLTEIVNKCADSAEIDTTVKEKEPTKKVLKGQDKEKDKPQAVFKSCKIYHDFYSCFVSNAKKLC